MSNDESNIIGCALYLKNMGITDSTKLLKVLAYAKTFSQEFGTNLIKGNAVTITESPDTTLTWNNKWDYHAVGFIDRYPITTFETIESVIPISMIPGEAYLFYGAVLLTELDSSYLHEFIHNYQVIDVLDDNTVCIKLPNINRPIDIEKGCTPGIFSDIELQRSLKLWHFRSLSDRNEIGKLLDPIYSKFPSVRIYIILSLFPLVLARYPRIN